MSAIIDKWHGVIHRRDPAALDELLDDDVIFYSPVMHRPQPGKTLTIAYLTAAMEILGNAEFRYVEQWVGERSAVLEFSAGVDGIAINGVDMMHWNELPKIVTFKVFIRPLKAIGLLHELMARKLSTG